MITGAEKKENDDKFLYMKICKKLESSEEINQTRENSTPKT